MFQEEQAIRDGRNNFCKNKGQRLAPSDTLGAAKSAHGKGQQADWWQEGTNTVKNKGQLYGWENLWHPLAKFPKK